MLSESAVGNGVSSSDRQAATPVGLSLVWPVFLAEENECTSYRASVARGMIKRRL